MPRLCQLAFSCIAFAIGCSALAASHSASAVELRVQVTDSFGGAFPGAVVYLEPENPPVDPPPAAGIMDQLNQQFVPHILTVQRGAPVTFPNSDSIKHHVFSFSQAKTFEIRLYKGRAAEPIYFERSGEVELGCNVHDWMLGYIYVVDTPYFGRTGNDGIAVFEVPEDNYRLGVWHPRIQDPLPQLTRQIRADETLHEVTLREPLLPAYDPEAASEFSDYD